ncbi:MAG: QueT transporter family protein [Nitrososphaeria archaeon]
MSILIAAIYSVLTIVLSPISYLAAFQIRVADALIPLSYNKKISKAAIYGTALGAFVANIYSFYGVYDMLIGTIANFVASYSAYSLSRYKGLIPKFLASLVSFLIIVFLIGVILFHLVLQIPIEVSLFGISIGSFISIVILGTLLLLGLEKVY